jgi:hypothetical protein
LSDVIFEWKGDEVLKTTLAAAKKGINATLVDCVTDSKALVPKKTTILQGSIQMRTAKEEVGELRGEFGSYNNNYAIHIEFGTKPHIITSKGPWPLRNKETGQVFGRIVFHPGSRARPFLRPSADRHFPTLAHRIAAYLGTYGSGG